MRIHRHALLCVLPNAVLAKLPVHRWSSVAACVLSLGMAGCGGGSASNPNEAATAVSRVPVKSTEVVSTAVTPEIQPGQPSIPDPQVVAAPSTFGVMSPAAPVSVNTPAPAVVMQPVVVAAVGSEILATPAPVFAPVLAGVDPLSTPRPRIAINAPVATTAFDAQRLANQGSFGPTEALVSEIKAQGASAWVATQMSMAQRSRYTSGMDSSVHQTGQDSNEFCAGKSGDCWRDYFSAEPLLWDFYRNAMTQPDQLRQRVALALQQILVVNNQEVTGTYGLRGYQNTLLDSAFSNYRTVLKKASLSPVMGYFLNNVNNNRTAPNENYARELLQLFSIGTCELNQDGSLKGGRCMPTYTNETVRSYAFALTGWTFPAGGKQRYDCLPLGVNCLYYAGDMVSFAPLHDTESRKLLSNVVLPSGHTAPDALEKVLDSLMAHPNTAPFVAKQLIQHLVSSNPSPAYVQRVATAFQTGKYGDFGSTGRGDLAATVAAVLLDTEARSSSVSRFAGKLREPVLMFTGVLRALNGYTDGDALSWWWGQRLRQHLFRAPSVFNFYPPDHPVAGTNLTGPAFAIHEASTALERLNFVTYIVDWGGANPNGSIPNAMGTKINVDAFLVDAADAPKLVDRLSALALGQSLSTQARDAVIKNVSWWTPEREAVNWKKFRVHTAAYLIFSSPQYQVQH
jgi:uncharacterized protein (DUF1800 family)